MSSMELLTLDMWILCISRETRDLQIAIKAIDYVPEAALFVAIMDLIRTWAKFIPSHAFMSRVFEGTSIEECRLYSKDCCI